MPLYVTGAAIHTGLVNFEFDVEAPYSGCRICGALFQSTVDRQYLQTNQNLHTDSKFLKRLKYESDRLRDEWRTRHARSHTEKEHELLAQSGDWCTPTAAHKLAPFGIFPLESEGEIAEAMFEAPRAPVNDVER